MVKASKRGPKRIRIMNVRRRAVFLLHEKN